LHGGTEWECFSETTTEQVIRALLAKYKITDNPRKFALYEKVEQNGKGIAI